MIGFLGGHAPDTGKRAAIRDARVHGRLGRVSRICDCLFLVSGPVIGVVHHHSPCAIELFGKHDAHQGVGHRHG